MSGKNKPGAKKPRCEICKTTENVTLAPDPFNVDVYDDASPRYLCDECRLRRREDI
jgi:hypothetical protein